MTLLPIQPAVPAGGTEIKANTSGNGPATTSSFASTLTTSQLALASKADKKEAKSNEQIAPTQVLDLIASLIPQPSLSAPTYGTPQLGVLASSPVAVPDLPPVNPAIAPSAAPATASGSVQTALAGVLTKLDAFAQSSPTALKPILAQVRSQVSAFASNLPNLTQPQVSAIAATLTQLQQFPALTVASGAPHLAVDPINIATNTGIANANPIDVIAKPIDVVAQPIDVIAKPIDVVAQPIDHVKPPQSINPTFDHIILNGPWLGRSGPNTPVASGGAFGSVYGNQVSEKQPTGQMKAPMTEASERIPIPSGLSTAQAEQQVAQTGLTVMHRLSTLLSALDGTISGSPASTATVTSVSPTPQIPNATDPIVVTAGTPTATPVQNSVVTDPIIRLNPTSVSTIEVGAVKPAPPVLIESVAGQLTAESYDRTNGQSTGGFTGSGDNGSYKKEEPTKGSPKPSGAFIVQSPLATTTPPVRQVVTLDTVKSVGSQIAQQARDLLSTKLPGKVTVVLQPESLGTVTVTVKQVGGKVEADFQATDGRLRQALSDHKADLVKTIEDKGLKMDGYNVGQHHQGGQNKNGSAPSQQDFQRAQNLNKFGTALIEPTPAVAKATTSDRLLDTQA